MTINLRIFLVLSGSRQGIFSGAFRLAFAVVAQKHLRQLFRKRSQFAKGRKFTHSLRAGTVLFRISPEAILDRAGSFSSLLGSQLSLSVAVFGVDYLHGAGARIFLSDYLLDSQVRFNA